MQDKGQKLGLNFKDVYRAFDWREFACGCGSAFINIALTYPIYKMIFRQMLHNVQITSAYSQLREEGIAYLYRGILPPMIQKTLSFSVMFGVYEGSRRGLEDHLHFNQYPAKAMAGMIAGCAELIFIPLERVQTLLADSKYHLHFPNTLKAFQFVWKNHGFTEFYRGIGPVAVRNGPGNVFFFISREEASKFIPENVPKSRKFLYEFFYGACIGAMCSTFFYPVNTVKIQMQSQLGYPKPSMYTTFKKMYHERGGKIRYFYRGCTYNAYRSFISWGIMNTAYENLKYVFY